MVCIGPYIQVSFGVGTDRDDAVKKALSLARWMKCGVEFDFNGCKTWVNPKDTLDEALERMADMWKRHTYYDSRNKGKK